MLNTLDPRCALLIVDLQKGLLGLPAIHPFTEIIYRSSILADAFRRHGLPVVLVNAAGIAPGRTEQPRSRNEFSADWTPIVPELEGHPEDLRVTKRPWGAFSQAHLRESLEQLHIMQVVITGVATSIGVESTARQAYELGYNVALAIDAMTDLNRECHDNSVTRIFPKLGETGTTQEICNRLEQPRA